MTIRVLLVDDHSVVRQGLRMFLNLDAELEVVGEAANGSEGVRLARELQPDVLPVSRDCTPSPNLNLLWNH